jgi:hypothetical protein
MLLSANEYCSQHDKHLDNLNVTWFSAATYFNLDGYIIKQNVRLQRMHDVANLLHQQRDIVQCALSSVKMCSLMVHSLCCIHRFAKGSICPFLAGIQHCNQHSPVSVRLLDLRAAMVYIKCF